MYLVLNKANQVWYEAISLEDARYNCPPGYVIVPEDEYTKWTNHTFKSL